MGNSICYFVDTGLYDLTPQMFLNTFEKRCGSKIILKGAPGSPYVGNCDDDSSQWSFWCGDSDFDSAFKYTEIELKRVGEDVSFEMGYWENTFDIDELRVDREKLFFSNDRFFNFISFLSKYTERTLHDLKKYIDAVKKYIQPIVNCHRLFLCGDQVYSSDRESWEAHLLDGMSIDEALAPNSKNPNPEPVFTWDNLEELMDHDIDDTAIFVFELDHLPEFLK